MKILFQEQDGYGSAIIEGLLNSKTEYSCIINADGSMDPKYLNSMLENLKVYDKVEMRNDNKWQVKRKK